MPQLEAGRRCRWKVRVDHAGMGRGTRARPTDRGRGLVHQPGRPGDVLDGNRNALRAYHEGDRVSEAFWPIIAALASCRRSKKSEASNARDDGTAVRLSAPGAVLHDVAHQVVHVVLQIPDDVLDDVSDRDHAHDLA